MSLVRAFIAIEIPSGIQSVIDQQTASLRTSADSSLVRWVNTCNLHLTLKFLGDVSTNNLPFLTQMMTNEASKVAAFEVEVGRLGSFPNAKRPRVIWIGIQAPAVLETLQRALEAGAGRLGYTPENRPFSPHLTIGRVRPNLAVPDQRRLQRALESQAVGRLGAAKVDAVLLIKSELRPEGSRYTRLFSAPLSSPLPTERDV